MENNNNKNKFNEMRKKVAQKTTFWLMKCTAPILLIVIVLIMVYHVIVMIKYGETETKTFDKMKMFEKIKSFLTDIATMLGIYAVVETNREKYFSKVDASNDEK